MSPLVAVFVVLGKVSVPCAHFTLMRVCMYVRMYLANYRMAGNLGGEFILADWRF